MDANPGTRRRARTLRRQTTLPEGLLWRELKAWRADGLHFRRQHPAGRYVLDFYCFTYRLAVEVDGAFHHIEGRQARDAERDRWLEASGIRVLRLPASLVLKDMTTAADMILHAIEQQRTASELPGRSPPGELSARSDD
jgi:very-short-patch-repair endonuclease